MICASRACHLVTSRKDGSDFRVHIIERDENYWNTMHLKVWSRYVGFILPYYAMDLENPDVELTAEEIEIVTSSY